MNGSCTNGRGITRAALEARMLDGLRDRLMAPEIAAEAMRAFAEETNRLNRDRPRFAGVQSLISARSQKKKKKKK
jgi:site-specific DNA recombinase